MIRTSLQRAAAVLTRRHRSVLMSYPGLRMGNVLYFALQAGIRRKAGEDFRILESGSGAGWLEAFPSLNPYMLPSSQLRFSDRRVGLPPLFFQEWGIDFTQADLESFIQSAILSAPAWREWREGCGLRGEGVTINVRRGDYYSNPDFRKVYGFDVERYVHRVIDHIRDERGQLGPVNVVSDDPQWCRQHLNWLSNQSSSLTFMGPESGVLSNFFSIAASRTLLITNSTFSYWASYVSNEIYGDNRSQVWVPSLHSRAVRDGRPWQHDPAWRAIDVEV